MMDQFVVRYIPGGMSLNHSGWWLCEKIMWRDGSFVEYPQKYLRRSDYIQQLAEQSGIREGKGFLYTHWDPLSGHSFDKQSLETFARLLVSECIGIIEDKRSSGENTDEWTITRDKAFHEMSEEIAKRFGVDK